MMNERLSNTELVLNGLTYIAVAAFAVLVLAPKCVPQWLEGSE